ncbi:MAG: hypothetical protein M3Y64_09045 [Gemmatimonadota bacterium]|nr:hypothetical protein [Gemmatimonadota bacterium]
MPSRNIVLAVSSALFFPFVLFFLIFFHLSWAERLLVALLTTPVLVRIFGNCFVVAHRWHTSSAAADAFFTHSNAVKTVSLSQVKAMIAVANAPAASDKFDELLATHGLDEALCRAAVDFHLGKLGSAARGEALLKRMRSENPAQFEHYVTQRLIDLYMTDVDTYPRARAELGRLAGQNPGTPEAAGALAAIERIKAASR